MTDDINHFIQQTFDSEAIAPASVAPAVMRLIRTRERLRSVKRGAMLAAAGLTGIAVAGPEISDLFINATTNGTAALYAVVLTALVPLGLAALTD